MKLTTTLCLLALGASALLSIPAATASTPDPVEPAVLETMTAPSCSAVLPFTEPPAFLPEARAKEGCNDESCDLDCRNRNYDYGVCFGSTCICRFYY